MKQILHNVFGEKITSIIGGILALITLVGVIWFDLEWVKATPVLALASGLLLGKDSMFKKKQ